MKPTPAVRAALLLALLTACVRGQTFPPFAEVPPFAGPFAYDPGPNLFGVWVYPVDLDGDGRDDLVSRSAAGGNGVTTFRYRLSNPNGSLGPVFEVPVTSGYAFGCVDIGDGTRDLIAITAGCPAFVFYSNQGRNCAQSPPLSITPFAVVPPCLAGATARNLGVRGNTVDVLYEQGGGAGPIVRIVEAGTITIPPGPGGSPVWTPVGGPYVIAAPILQGGGGQVIPCELNGDGIMDFLAQTTGFLLSPTTIEIVIVTPGGPYLNPPTPAITGAALAVYAHDLTGDGLDEVITQSLSSPPQVTVYLNLGAVGQGVLLSPLPSIAGWNVGDFADLDGDGDVDIVACSGSQLGALLNDGSGLLSSCVIGVTSSSIVVKAGDLDGDGDVDIVTGGTSVQVFLNQSGPTAVTRPGTADGIVLGSSVQPPGMPAQYSTAPFFDFKTASGAADVGLRLSAPSFPGANAFLMGEAFGTGCPPVPVLSDVWVSSAPTVWILGPLAIPAGGNVDVTVPVFVGPVALNLSLIVQFAIVSTSAANGAYATTAAHEIQF